MQRIIRGSIRALLACGSIVTLSASPAVIGVARTQGAFVINNASVPGTATILDGTSLRTLGRPSDVRLKTGEHVIIGSNSAVTIYQDRLVLQSGMAELDRLSTYRVEAGDLRIGASNPAASVRVTVSGGRQLQVAATTGNAEVRNAEGLLLARVLSGTALQLRSTPDSSSTEITGRVTSEQGKFFLTDETTKVKFELRGPKVKNLVGKRVHVSGSTVTPGSAGGVAVVTVSSATVLAAAAGGVPGASTAGGLSTTMSVVTGIAATAGTFGSLGAAGTFNDATVSR